MTGHGGDAGLVCLATIANFHGIPAQPTQMAHSAGLPGNPATPDDLVLIARALGLKARAAKFNLTQAHIPILPVLVLDKHGNHFVVAKLSDDGSVLIMEGHSGETRVVSLDEIQMRSTDKAILLASRASLSGELSRFDLSWFVPSLYKYRSLLVEALLISCVIQAIGLVPPLMFQVVMDKVLVNGAINTLNVVCIALILSAIIETTLTAARNYILSHTTTRIDVELGARLFRHLVSLPLGYFQARRVGDTLTRVRELENIRNFLTGQALTAIIDFAFSLAILIVMYLYSPTLTLLTIASFPCYGLILGAFNPTFRRRLNAKFARFSDSQSLLVEVVSGIETVKSLAVQPQFVRRWNQQLAAYVSASLRVTTLANVGQQLIQSVSRVAAVATLYVGTLAVIDGRLSVGGLIAFNMMAQRVSAPVLRLAQLWQDFQQIGLSIDRLGDVLNTRSELSSSNRHGPAIQGAIAFKDVRFRYLPDSPLVLRGITFSIEPGQVVGVVGRSGSGKSTLARLLQKLYIPESGRITVDGLDISVADTEWLRRQVGVVLQENILFSRSIRENIAVANPGMSIEEVIRVAHLAGIHDSICQLPNGYDTVVGEQGTGLSGGQKQRIAIARALAGDPRILIFDEATSALDYETERAIQANMPLICRDRTVIIIAHRLSAVRHADMIVAMDGGSVVEMDRHERLLAANGYYAKLVAMQTA